jgi:gamma-D-glutamyl-L-lysine dipeptidyl-peptidase
MFKTGINNFTIIPIRKEPSDTSEMVSQIIFGETFEILEVYENWALIELHYDGYRGWIDKKQIKYIDEELQEIVKNSSRRIVDKFITTARTNTKEGLIYILPGSVLYKLYGTKFNIADEEYELTYPLTDSISSPAELLIISAFQMLNVPYLWGGISSFGIDCSGLVQTSCKIAGVKIPRDASEQAEVGKTINSLGQSKPADLVYFENSEGKIIHTGILLATGKIIHASGSVRIDSIDNHGIYNNEIKNYTHKLKAIKRIIE